MPPQDFRRKFRNLILLAWNLPPIVGMSFIIFIGVLSPEQMLTVLTTPFEPIYIIGWIIFSIWYFPRLVKPIEDICQKKQIDKETISFALKVLQVFPLYFWAFFLIYLLIAPASVILSAEYFTDYVATPVDWFRIELIALIVSIIVGLPIFFLIFDLFGKALNHIEYDRPYITVKSKVFLIGALIPLLIDTMLVQYYWTRTGFFSFETFLIWLSFEVLAVMGSLIFVKSFGQSLSPLQQLTSSNAGFDKASISDMHPMSTDELGLLTQQYRKLLEELDVHNKVLNFNNQILRSTVNTQNMPETVNAILPICQEAIKDDIVFLLLHDQDSNELVGVAQSDLPFLAEGYYRLPVDEVSIASWTFNNDETCIVLNCENDIRVSVKMREKFGAQSAIVTPLRAEGKNIGILMSIAQSQRQSYSKKEISLIEGVARDIATVIFTQRLNDERIRAENEVKRHRDHLEELVEERTLELKKANRELETFSYSVSHDLRSPLRAIDGFSEILLNEYADKLDENGQSYFQRIRSAAGKMGELIDDLLNLSRISRAKMNIRSVDLGKLATSVIATLESTQPERDVEWIILSVDEVKGDERLLYIVMQNLLENAWKYSAKNPTARIEFGSKKQNNKTVYYVSDNGAGFDMVYAEKIFGAFQRLHHVSEYEGTGIGLATVQRIIQLHGGQIWAEAEIDKGATFYFTLNVSA